MILTVIIENTNIFIGCADEKKSSILFESRISTILHKTASEYAITIKDLLSLKEIDSSQLTGGIIASCVPHLTDTIIDAIHEIYDIRIMEVGPGLKSGVNIRIDTPSSLGADLLASAVAGIQEYGYPLVIANLCTAGTLSVIDESGCFVGCLIIPGIRSTFETFAEKAAFLTPAAIKAPDKVIGSSTEKAMQSGVILGCAASIDGLISEIENELGTTNIKCVITGEFAKLIAPYCHSEPILDAKLMMKGLIIIYKKNKKYCKGR